MPHQMNRLSLQSPLKILCVLVLHLLLTHSCRGQSQLIGSSQPIVATVGDDVILPCQLKPAEDVSARTVQWTRPDLNSLVVHVRRAGQETIAPKHPSYQGRTSLFIDRLKQGNISLKLSKVKLADGGNYSCHIPHINESFIELIVVSDVIPSPVISVVGLDRVRGGVVLQCESKGWHPQPEVFWLDDEGNFLSAEPTETVRGPDGLYTVSSRVTVEKRLSNSITCRVQQNKINQTRETHFIVPGDFFKVQSSSSPVIIGLAVSLVVSLAVIVVVAVSFFVWKWKQNKTKRGEFKGDPEIQPLNGAQSHGITLTVGEEEQQKKEKAEKEKEVETLKKELQTKQKELETKTIEIETLQESEKQLKAQNEEWERKQADTDRLLQEEKQNREREVKDLKNQLDSKQKEIDKLLKLLEENQRREEKDLETLKENLETKTKELETMKPGLFKGSKKEKAAKEKVETLKKELQTKQEEFDTNTKKIEEITAEFQRTKTDNKD